MRLSSVFSVFLLCSIQLAAAAAAAYHGNNIKYNSIEPEEELSDSPSERHLPRNVPLNSTTTGAGASKGRGPGRAPPPPPDPGPAPGTYRVGQAIKTTSGTVYGHPAPNASDVSEYLGIPYAQPATGNLRLAPPVAYSGTAMFRADRYSNDCPVPSSGASGPPPGAPPPPPAPGAAAPSPPKGGGAPPQQPPGPPTGNLANSTLSPAAESAMILGKLAQSIASTSSGEDCLSVNIWTKPQTGENAKAVMMWIYGGGFQSGTSHAAGYDGSKIADEEDVVVVTFNYRTNFFGFAAPPNSTAYNYGLLDQRMATEWVRSNIAGFGGDPNRITLFGQSAGGASVDLYSYAWTKDPIINAFIPESGAAGVLTAGDPLATQKWYNMSKALNCGGPEVSGPMSLACVRRKPLGAVLNATTIVPSGFIPVIDNVTLFSDYAALGASGNFIKRPILVGNNNNEARLFAAIGELSGQPLSPKAQASMNLDFICPAASAAKFRSANNITTYRYMYMGDWPNMNISAETGAFHSAEVPMIFGNLESVVGIMDTEPERDTARLMRDLWVSFVKDPDKGLDGFGLPSYDVNGNTLIQLGFNNTVLPVMAPSTKFDGACNGTLTPFNPTLG